MSDRLCSPGLRLGAAAVVVATFGLMAAPNTAQAAERVVLIEHFTATW